jgi:hypothetical protein
VVPLNSYTSSDFMCRYVRTLGEATDDNIRYRVKLDGKTFNPFFVHHENFLHPKSGIYGKYPESL